MGTRDAYASLIVTPAWNTRENELLRVVPIFSLSLSPPSLSLFARYIKQASNNRISSVVSPAKLLIKCNGVTQLLRS